MSRASELEVVRTLRTMLLAVALSAAAVGCGVEAGADYPVNDYGGGYPPDGYIATTEPVYYGGYATYWYGGSWYYRDGGGRWGHYDREPAALAQRRMQGGPVRRRYEVARPRPASGGRSVGHR
jgi:hypothetical protein